MPIDPVKQAEELQRIFLNLSNTVDDLRIRNFLQLTQPQRQRLKEQSDALETRGLQFTAVALAAIQQQIEPHLANIKDATQKAQDALDHLNDVAKAFALVDATVALVGSVVTGDVASIIVNLQGLTQTIGAA